MAKTQELAERTRNQKSSKTLYKNKKKNSIAINTKNYKKIRNNEIATDDDSSEVLIVLSSSTESQNEDVLESSEEQEEVNERNPSDEGDREEKEKPKFSKKKGTKEGVKDEGKRRMKKEDEEEEEAEETSENALYKFPLNRISRIIKSNNSDLKISKEAVFVINRASEKFVELFSREAYACAFIDHKNHIAYNHMSSVVCKRKRFDFLSDFVPEKVKVEDALAQMPEAEK